jgi:hypothetical protein
MPFANGRILGAMVVTLGLGSFCSGGGLAHAACVPATPTMNAQTDLLRLEVAHQGTPGTLPGGCATLAAQRVCVPPVTLDGHRLSDLEVLEGDVVFASRVAGSRSSLQSPRAVQAGVAEAVFKALVGIAAKRDHITATTAEARKLAQRELGLYEACPPARGRPSFIPRGMTARQYFLSRRTIEGYRYGMVVGRERARILRHFRGMSEPHAFQLWLETEIPKHTVRIDGKPPTFSIARAYLY